MLLQERVKMKEHSKEGIRSGVKYVKSVPIVKRKKLQLKKDFYLIFLNLVAKII